MKGATFHVWVGDRCVRTVEIGAGVFRTKRVLEMWVTRTHGASREPVMILTNKQHRERLSRATSV